MQNQMIIMDATVVWVARWEFPPLLPFEWSDGGRDGRIDGETWRLSRSSNYSDRYRGLGAGDLLVGSPGQGKLIHEIR